MKTLKETEVNEKRIAQIKSVCMEDSSKSVILDANELLELLNERETLVVRNAVLQIERDGWRRQALEEDACANAILQKSLAYRFLKDLDKIVLPKDAIQNFYNEITNYTSERK